MSTDRQRDAGLDRLLRAALRSPPAGSGPCPDAELVAAYAERRLAGGERDTLEVHLASCEACQQALALLAHEDVSVTVAGPARSSRSLIHYWRWLAPAAMVAGGVVLYVAVRPGVLESPGVPESVAVQMAQRSEEAANEGRGGRDEIAGVPEPAEAPRTRGAVSSRGSAAPADRAAAPEAPASTSPAKAEDQALRPAAPPAGQELPAVMAQAAADVPPPAPVAAAKPEKPALEKRAVAAGAAPAPQAAMRREAAAAKSAPADVMVASSDGAGMWRLGAGGFISRSNDGGRNWQPQASGVNVDLTAGHAPSAKVCWVVGRLGTVLLTTDGEQWVARPFPEQVDLVGIEARDAGTATVTTSDGRRFGTTDGGVTWRVRR